MMTVEQARQNVNQAEKDIGHSFKRLREAAYDMETRATRNSIDAMQSRKVLPIILCVIGAIGLFIEPIRCLAIILLVVGGVTAFSTNSKLAMDEEVIRRRQTPLDSVLDARTKI